MPKLQIKEIQLFERPVQFRMPFRFGVITLTFETELLVRTLVELEDGRRGWGFSADVYAPKWFDKNPELTNLDNEDQLRESVSLASALYQTRSTYITPFDLFATNYEAQLAACRKKHLNPLIAGFGPALLDRAVLDALCRIHGISFFQAIRENLPGIHATDFLPEFEGFDFASFLGSLRPSPLIHARHTVGLLDPITAGDVTAEERIGDGLPETLEEVVSFYGNTYYKLKLCGDGEKDISRLSSIARVLDRLEKPYFVTLDGNEQYNDLTDLLELWKRLEGTADLRRFRESILMVEQPIKRQNAFEKDVSSLSSKVPVIIDESDEDLDAFPKSRYFGYRGVSSKQCKGVYRSILNRARCRLWNQKEGADRFLMSGEDLTTQPGVAVQQDLALATLIGLTHLERNAHHYSRGLSNLSEKEQSRLLEAHSGLYTRREGLVQLRVTQGELDIRSLDCPGLGVGPEPDWAAYLRVR
ncbi:MAG: mandelate racemase [Acidobacteriota bacterium]|nr:MAG: mandelate racemase [Acidobacteriota bacterium]